MRMAEVHPRAWTYEHLYTVQDDYFRDLIKGIEASTHFIAMETYIYEKGVLADRITKALCDAARRGVQVRLLIDGIGSPSFSSEYEATLSDGGVIVRYYRILPWMF